MFLETHIATTNLTVRTVGNHSRQASAYVSPISREAFPLAYYDVILVTEGYDQSCYSRRKIVGHSFDSYCVALQCLFFGPVMQTQHIIFTAKLFFAKWQPDMMSQD